MSLPLFIPSIEEILSLLMKSHASYGGTVLISRSGKVWNNPSTKSILNSWRPKDSAGRLLQTSFLDICGNGDGCKLGIFVACSLIRDFVRLGESAHPLHTERVKKSLPEVLDRITPLYASESILLEIGMEGGLDITSVRSVAEALTLSGASSSHISLEKGKGVGIEVEESDSLVSSTRVHHDSEVYLSGAMFALFAHPVFKIEQILTALESMGSFEGRPLVVVAPVIGSKALSAINLNRSKGVLEVYACEAPRVTWGRGWLDDLAAFTGATVFDEKVYPEYLTEFFGSALDVVLNRHEMVVTPYDDHAESASLRADALLREAQTIPFAHTQDLWKQRANALTGTLVKIKVGGVTEAEARWKRSLVEKSLISMSDASVNGCVKGVIPMLHQLPVENPLLKKALSFPYAVVCENYNTSIADKSMMTKPHAYDHFPIGRLKEILTKAVSVATTVGSVCHITRR